MSFKRLLKTKPRHWVAKQLTGVTLSHSDDDIDEATGLPSLRILEPVNLSNDAFDFVLRYPYRWHITLWCELDDDSIDESEIKTSRCELNDLSEFIEQERTRQVLNLHEAFNIRITRQGWHATNSL